ncbi:MAG: imidazole glycerol phosphate synthase subunit HisH [Anaerolineales bacterium]|jgi:glutamine amidotransferase
MSDVVLVDAGTGNLRSVGKALESLGADVLRTSEPVDVLSARKVVLPGVGAFGDFMSGLRERGLEPAVRDVAERGIPLLGICVGMQALFEVGEEMGEYPGLGLLPGRVLRFPDSLEVKIPHTGWNQVEPMDDASLFAGLPSGEYVYFNHSYYSLPGESSDVSARTEYGISYACAVERGNIFGVQFHPEKSQRVGLKILENFLRIAS